MEVTGVLTVGEATSAMAYVKARRGVSPRQVKGILLVCMLAVGIPLAAWASGSWRAAALSVEFAVLGLGVGLLIVQGLAAPSIRKALAERGQAWEQPLTLSLSPEALVYDLGDLTKTARWPCVTDLYRTPGTGSFWFRAAPWSCRDVSSPPPRPNATSSPKRPRG